jgi:hypothetical protein
MILLISSHPEAERCVPVLSRELGERVECVDNLRTAASKLRDFEYELVAVDQGFVETHTAAVEALLSHEGSALPLFLNPVVQGTKRLVMEARAALRRRECERRSAAENALRILRNDLRSDLTAILLSSQLALGSGAVSEAVAANLKSICTLAERLGKKLA